MFWPPLSESGPGRTQSYWCVSLTTASNFIGTQRGLLYWNKLNFGHEMGWDLELFAAGLQCLQLDTPLLEQHDTKKLDVTKNNRACPVGANSEQKTQKDQNTQLTPLKSLRQKQGPGHAPCTQHLQSQGKTPQPSLQPDPWTHPYPHPI